MSTKEQELIDVKAALVEFEADNDTEMVAIFKEEIAKMEEEIASEKQKPGKSASEKQKPVKSARQIAPYQKEAKALGINSFGKTKVKVLEEIEAKKNPKPIEQKQPSIITFDETAKQITLKNGIILERNINGFEWEVNSQKHGDSFNSAYIKKTGNDYTVSIKHSTIGFKSFADAVSHLKTELHNQILLQFIDEKKVKAEKQKEWKDKHGNSLSITESIKNEIETIDNKIEKDGIKTAEIVPIKTNIVKFVRTIEKGLQKQTDKKDFLKDLIDALTKMLKTI
jgi:hypothetical protein